ncbi:hypothetical protein F5B20DRAFT_591298 [Whalleya microplaca]|nr:hypothetical protein F5B20DRAFT_591298 [Whalleya microplaca]
MSKLSHLLSFVDVDEVADEDQTQATLSKQQVDAVMNAPIFSGLVDKFVNLNLSSDGLTTAQLSPQYGLIGIREAGPEPTHSPEDRLIIANMNIPWSAFICGSQGAGKSHTLSCLLENAIVAENAAGKLPSPLAGMVMHYDNYASYNTTQVCEAAYLCSSGIPVTVLVSPSNIWAMKRLYSNLPGLKPGAPRPKVLPLYLKESQLDISRTLKLMAVSPDSNSTPLYMEVVINIAREMAMEGPAFTYTEFCRRLENTAWARGQDGPLKLRLQLLDSFISPSAQSRSTRPAAARDDIWAFEPGTLTIIDLSDPFINSDDACTLFSIGLSIFLEERNKCGRVVVLDEAHKFLIQSGEAKLLTDDLTSIIRQQRHTGTRVLIATQEPTLSPELMDLANVTFVHRFLSPSWYEILKKHLAAASRQDSGDKNSLFDTIVALQTGEALLFCPTAYVDVEESLDNRKGVKPLTSGYMKVKIRKRLTVDGGKSMMATETMTNGSDQVAADEVPMHVVTARDRRLGILS